MLIYKHYGFKIFPEDRGKMGEGKHASDKKVFFLGREGLRDGKRPKLSTSIRKLTGDI